MKQRYSSPLMNESEEIETSGGGMSGIMDEFFRDSKDGIMPEKEIEDIIESGDSTSDSKEDVPVTSEENEDAPDAEPDGIDEDEFPDLGGDNEETSDGDEFNEDEFDKETQALLKSIEEKGHPGDVYKKLRSELKEAKLSSSNKQVNLDEIPEYVDLKNEVDELRSIKDEVEGLRTQRDELLKVADEAAIEVLPEFISNVKEPLSLMDKDLSAIASASGIDKATLLAVVREGDIGKQDKMIADLEDQLSRRALSRLEHIIDDYPKVIETRDRMYENKSAEIAKSRENQEIEAKQRADAQIQEFQSNTKEIFSKYAKSVPGFIDSTGNLSQKAQTEMKKAFAINIHDLSTGDVAFLAFAARAIGPMREEIRRLQGSSGVPATNSSKPASVRDPGTKKKSLSDDEPQSLMKAMEGKDFTFDSNFAGATGY